MFGESFGRRPSAAKPRDGWQASYQDPLRWKFPDSSKEYYIAGDPRVDQCENELCTTKVLVMHKPSHEPARESSGEYPFSWHLGERRRLWEVRLQLRFKKVPERLFFGVELGNYVPISGTSRAVQKALVSACRKIVGDCYHTPGDDPSCTAGECELPTFVMPLWAFDQFEVSDPGNEPDLTGDLEKVGRRRTEGVRSYIRAMGDTIKSFSTEKVYTFCFWGVSPFLNCIKWEICGTMFPVKIDFNKLCGKPPVYITIYDLPGVRDTDSDQRHLPSRKRHYLRVATWSGPRPASLDGAEAEDPVVAAASVEAEAELPAEDLLQLTQRLDALPDLMAMEDQGASIATSQAESFDLLGLDFGAPSQAPAASGGYSAAAPAEAPKKPGGETETVDLLGLI